MQFLHLFHEVYPACEDLKKNRLSYPYAVRIPDKEKRVEFEKMLANEGFECVVHENGYPVVYVNLTLKRFGNAVKAAASGTIDGGKLHERDEFVENIYNRYQTDESFRKSESNNYALSAALSILGAIRGIARNQNCSDKKYKEFEIGRIREGLDVISEFLEEVK